MEEIIYGLVSKAEKKNLGSAPGVARGVIFSRRYVHHEYLIIDSLIYLMLLLYVAALLLLLLLLCVNCCRCCCCCCMLHDAVNCCMCYVNHSSLHAGILFTRDVLCPPASRFMSLCSLLVCICCITSKVNLDSCLIYLI